MLPTPVFLGFHGGSDGKESTAMWETWVRSLGWEDPLEEGMLTHTSILAWRIPMDRGAWGRYSPLDCKEFGAHTQSSTRTHRHTHTYTYV